MRLNLNISEQYNLIIDNIHGVPDAVPDMDFIILHYSDCLSFFFKESKTGKELYSMAYGYDDFSESALYCSWNPKSWDRKYVKLHFYIQSVFNSLTRSLDDTYLRVILLEAPVDKIPDLRIWLRPNELDGCLDGQINIIGKPESDCELTYSDFVIPYASYIF